MSFNLSKYTHKDNAEAEEVVTNYLSATLVLFYFINIYSCWDVILKTYRINSIIQHIGEEMEIWQWPRIVPLTGRSHLLAPPGAHHYSGSVEPKPHQQGLRKYGPFDNWKLIGGKLQCGEAQRVPSYEPSWWNHKYILVILGNWATTLFNCFC